MRHNLFYVDNTSQVRGGLRGTLSEEAKKGSVGVPALNSSKPGGGLHLIYRKALVHMRKRNIGKTM